MNRLMAYLVGGVFLVVGGAFVGWLFGLESGQKTLAKPAETSTATLEFQLQDQAEKIQKIAQKIEEVSSQFRDFRENSATARPAEPSRKEILAVVERLEEIEKLLEKVRAESAAAPPVISSKSSKQYNVEMLKSSIRELDGSEDRKRLSQRVRLRERLLDEFPEDSESARMLEELISDSLALKDPHKALTHLKRYGSLLPAWKKSKYSGSIYLALKDYNKARDFFRNVQNSEEAPEWSKAEAMFYYAYSFQQEGDNDQAKAYYYELVSHYGSTPPPGVHDAIVGAKTQLKAIEEAGSLK